MKASVAKVNHGPIYIHYLLLSNVNHLDCSAGGVVGRQVAVQRLSAGLQLSQQRGGDGDVVAASQLPNLAGVAEGRGHDDGLEAVRLVVAACGREESGYIMSEVVERGKGRGVQSMIYHNLYI